jgi:hypothetical protein
MEGKTPMNPIVLRSTVVIVLRTLVPLIAGGGLAIADEEYETLAAALLAAGYVAFQVWKRVKGKKAVAVEIAIARSEPAVNTTVAYELQRRG